MLDLESWARRALLAEGEVLAVAHRGASAESPENTAAAFETALAQPIHALETDLQLSRDAVPVVYHDRTLAKLGAPRATVASLDLAALRKLDAGAWFARRFAGQTLPTLDELLDAYGRRTCLLLEIKARDAESAAWHRRLLEKVVAALQARGLVDAVLLLCFDLDLLAAARGLEPRLRTVLNLKSAPRARDAWARFDGLFALSIDVRGLERDFVLRAHERAQPVLTYTCNTPRRVRAALAAGVDGVMSDRPGWLVATLAASGASSRRP